MKTRLAPEHAQSPTYAALKALVQEHLEGFRQQNDRNLSLEDTAILRGKIAACKWLLTLGDPPRVNPEAQDEIPFDLDLR